MTTLLTVVNNALQKIGTRTTVASLTESSNEAIQANSSIFRTRDELLRMAPWNCANTHAPLVYITSAPGTPENLVPSSGFWAKGQPPPGWAYEYQYPVDCLKVLYLIPQMASGLGAITPPITQAITGAAPSVWRRGAPVKFGVGVDQFLGVTAATVAAGGTGYTSGEEITLVSGQVAGQPPIGAPVRLIVATLSGSAVATVQVVSQTYSSAGDQSLGVPVGGSYYRKPTNPVAQAFSNGSGTGATFNLVFSLSPFKFDQRVILANQSSAICCYIRSVTNNDVMDPLFVDAWTSMLAANLAIALTGDKSLANMQIQLANNAIMEARKADGNEGLTVLDHTPDWIRGRGIYFPLVAGWNADAGYDWGGLLPSY